MDWGVMRELGMGGIFAFELVLFWLILRHEQKCKEDRGEMKNTLQRIEDRLDRGGEKIAVLDERTRH